MLYSVKIQHNPGFFSLLFNPTNGHYDLVFSSFTRSTLISDKILQIPSVSIKYKKKSKMVPQVITDIFTSPRQIGVVPAGAFGKYHYLTAATGFFFPGADNGSISIINTTDANSPGDPIIISSTVGGQKWFYHRVIWYDVDGDGDQDAITQRARGNGSHADASQLLWFENPGIIPPPTNWKAHILSTGYEDVNFAIHKLPLPGGRETLVIISGGFFSNRLTITWSIDNNWKKQTSIRHRIIDDAGWYLDLQIVDVNDDGIDDVLITTWSRPGKENIGAVLVYEVPRRDWRIDKWPKHVLSTDFEQDLGRSKGSPGTPVAFWRLHAAKKNREKPHIVVNGDDDGKLFLLKPDSEDPNDWSYTQSTILSTSDSEIVGTIAVGDVDGDGFIEFFIPNYRNQRIVVMTYKPQNW
uniref:uncharacterized protein LOC120331798 n=1 Tax=Styela clava TaxID=7725 RepID=UPI001939FBFB|nr:uncharacterized protein LOC120331798 [Styela clava]